jgi:hypothetical protein
MTTRFAATQMQRVTPMATPQNNFASPSHPISAMAKIKRYVARIVITAIVMFFATAVIAFIAAKFWIFFTHLSQ